MKSPSNNYLFQVSFTHNGSRMRLANVRSVRMMKDGVLRVRQHGELSKHFNSKEVSRVNLKLK